VNSEGLRQKYATYSPFCSALECTTPIVETPPKLIICSLYQGRFISKFYQNSFTALCAILLTQKQNELRRPKDLLRLRKTSFSILSISFDEGCHHNVE